ncbi:diguanylate cyclase [Herbaspirillum sp. ST 5-3]|uniref:GGDEF domain-containing protein n=1 Tax=Oxalobacteraceae TaxID=75682 RepID=UPI0010A57361|nr:diguanylate cyclase [Herbaspirillum sp. ST 5-3]
MNRYFRISPVTRLSLGIICLIFALVLVFDSFFFLLPSRQAQQANARSFGSRVIGDQVGALLARGDRQALQDMVDRLTTGSSEIDSIGIRRVDSTLVAASRNHLSRWTSSQSETSSPTRVAVPLFADKARWGEVELVFADHSPRTITDVLREPSMLFLLLLASLGFVLVYGYLRRALHYLDPSYSVPQRVRTAFDTLTEAVLILNAKGQIMLANAMFLELAGGRGEQLEGKTVAQLGWLTAGLNSDGSAEEYPWQHALRTNRTVQGRSLKVKLPDGRRHELIMNCSVINDGSGVARGCLVTLDDVTQLSEANTKLQNALHDLERSRDQIQQQNAELQKHAHHDHLTGCLNRRAFFAQAESVHQSSIEADGDLFCIMADIDHFKSFNDTYGHAVGDLVIQEVAAAVRRSLRSGDLFCRYGGEEFCILLSKTDESTGLEIAERIRTRIQEEAGPGVRSVHGLRITASLGISSLKRAGDYLSLPELIDQADRGLYVAKNAGRNRVAQDDGTIHFGDVAAATVAC